MKGKEHFCGDCRFFGNEDVYGMGYCSKSGDFSGFGVLKYCEEPVCSKFEEYEERE